MGIDDTPAGRVRCNCGSGNISIDREGVNGPANRIVYQFYHCLDCDNKWSYEEVSKTRIDNR